MLSNMKNPNRNGVGIMQYDRLSPIKFGMKISDALAYLDKLPASTGKLTFPVIGPSGVGKSTIVNLIAEQSDLRIQDCDPLRPLAYAVANKLSGDAVIDKVAKGEWGNYKWDDNIPANEAEIIISWLVKFDVVAGLTPELRVALSRKQGNPYGFFLCVPYDTYLSNIRSRNEFRGKDPLHRVINRLEYNRKWESAAKHRYTCVLYLATDNTEAVRCAGTILWLLQNEFKKSFKSKLNLSQFNPTDVRFASGWSMKF